MNFSPILNPGSQLDSIYEEVTRCFKSIIWNWWKCENNVQFRKSLLCTFHPCLPPYRNSTQWVQRMIFYQYGTMKIFNIGKYDYLMSVKNLHFLRAKVWQTKSKWSHGLREEGQWYTILNRQLAFIGALLILLTNL